MTASIRLGVIATRAGWGPELRTFLRDHASGVVVEQLMSPTQLPRPGQRALDVLIVDDQMPMLKAAHIAAAHDRGTHVIGLWDETAGRGRDYLRDLGVDEALPASTPPGELLRAVLRIGPVNAGTGPSDDTAGWDRHRAAPQRSAGWTRPPQPSRRATITAFAKVSGGAGQSEALAAVGQRLERRGTRVLVVEAGGGATLASRLHRSPEYGLSWCLERVAGGHRAIPDGLSPGREDGTKPLGAFDVICGTTSPAGPPPVNAAHLGQLLDQASLLYDHILLETGPLATPPAVAGGDRFAVARVVLARADQAVVFAAADRCAVSALVDWRSVVVHDLELEVASVAVFGRAPTRRFERAHLVDAVERNTGTAGFDAIHFLPEDRRVARARWDGEMVTSGRWAHAVAALAAAVGNVHSTKPPPRPGDTRSVPGRGGRRHQTAPAAPTPTESVGERTGPAHG